MKLSVILPGSSYSSTTNSYTIPVSAINAILTTPVTGKDNFEVLLMSLLDVLWQRGEDGFIQQWTCSAETNQRVVQQHEWQEIERQYDTVQLLTHQVSFNMTTAAKFGPNDIQQTTDT